MLSSKETPLILHFTTEQQTAAQRLRKDRLLNGQARETVRQSGKVEERKSQETARGRSCVIFKAQNAQLWSSTYELLSSTVRNIARQLHALLNTFILSRVLNEVNNEPTVYWHHNQMANVTTPYIWGHEHPAFRLSKLPVVIMILLKD